MNKINPLAELDSAICDVQKMNTTSLASPGAGLTQTGLTQNTQTNVQQTNVPNVQTSSGAGGAPSRVEYEVMPDVPLLHNHTAPYHVNKKERPAHRLMLELAAKGFTNKEIAETVGKTTVNVNNALRQPHSQQTLVNSIRERVSADEQVVEVIRSNVVKAVSTLAEIMDNDDAKNSDRIAAAEALLNRRYGKAVQPISAGSTVDLNNLPDSELAKMLPRTTETTTS